MADDPTIRWSLANPFGIQMDEAADAWHSGHATDVLELDSGGLLVATEKGGVWTVATTGATLPLSDSWPNPDVNCLAPGPDDPAAHFFAGCTGGIIRETDLGDNVPLLAWLPVANPLPGEAGDVHRIVVIRNLRRILAACDGGLYWATIPPSRQKRGCLLPFGPKPAPRPPYDWKRAKVEGAADQGFWDVAIGATRARQARSDLEDRRVITVVAGGFGKGGIFVGQWDSAGDLVLKRAAVSFDDGTDATALVFDSCGTTAVSSCEVRPTVLYAACAWPDGRLNSIVRSEDGGRQWRFCASHVEGESSPLAIVPVEAGDQGGNWNNCIAAAPTNPGMAALGWQEGPFLTLDGGKTFKRITDRTHLHADTHALRFWPNTPGNVHNLYVCSDGGVMRVNLDDYLGLTGQPYQSNYNRLLPTHQCYATYVARQFYGTLSASTAQAGLIASGVQDNGNIACQVDPTPTPWVQFDGGDGGWTAFMADGGLLHNIMGTAVGAARVAPGPTVTDLGVVPVGQPPTDPGGVAGPVGDAVRRPSYRNVAGQTLYAACGLGNQVFGCYPDSNPAGTYHWELIATLPAGVSIAGLGSFHGGTIHVGTGNGRMFAVDTKQGSALELPVVLPKPSPSATVTGGQVNRIVAFSETDFFAMMNGATATTTNPITGKKTTITSYYVLRLDELHWVVTSGMGLPQTPLFGLETVAEPGTRVPHALVASTDDRVYISRDDGITWQQASMGLPRNPHCADLRFVSARGGASLYLSTFGRSVYVVRLRGGQ